MGWMKDATCDYLVGLRLLAAAALMSGVIVVAATLVFKRAFAETPTYRSALS